MAGADQADRRALVVALGLMGVPPTDAETDALDAADPADAAAAALAAVAADPGGACERVTRLDRAAHGAARVVTDLALARVEAGNLVAVVG